MPTRRDALKTLTLGAGAALLLPGARAFALGSNQGSAPAAPPAAALPTPAGPFTLPPLPYAADALEPHLDAMTMTIHHDKHHAAYVTNLNKAIAPHADLAKLPVEELLRRVESLPAEVRTVVRNHGGGHANHTLWWASLSKTGARAPQGELAMAIDKGFGSFSGFQEKLTGAAAGLFGSGWAWLTYSAAAGLALETSPNQDSPLMAGRVPLVGIDVWEHAYYLKFQNRRADYLAEVLKVLDWNVISARYRDALKVKA